MGTLSRQKQFHLFHNKIWDLISFLKSYSKNVDYLNFVFHNCFYWKLCPQLMFLWQNAREFHWKYKLHLNNVIKIICKNIVTSICVNKKTGRCIDITISFFLNPGRACWPSRSEFSVVFLRNLRKYGLGSHRKIPTEGTSPILLGP